jgi:hypothetical protein
LPFRYRLTPVTEGVALSTPSRRKLRLYAQITGISRISASGRNLRAAEAEADEDYDRRRDSVAGHCHWGLYTAFRLIDGLLLRPMPVAHAERLYAVAFRSANVLDGRLMTYDSSSYPAFQQMKAAVPDRARLLAVSFVDRTDLTYGSDDDIKKAFTQFVSGDMFAVFGVAPAEGRLLGATDDVTPGAHPEWSKYSNILRIRNLR